MERIRTIGAMLAIVSALLAILFVYVGASITALLLIVAAGCMAAVVPFHASDPPARARVVAGCLIYTLAVAAALAWAGIGSSPGAHLLILAALTLGGGALTGWAFKTRKRRRRPTGMRAYFDR